MSVIQTITRISPVNMWSKEVFSKLSSPEQFGNPYKVEVCYITDPRTKMQYRMETTFICENGDSTKPNFNLALKCTRIPGLVPATSVNFLPSVVNNGFYTLNVPKVIKSPSASPMLGINRNIPSDAAKNNEKDSSIKLRLNLKAIEKMSQETSTQLEKEKRKKLLEPLLQYFIENECLICGFIALYESELNSAEHMASHISQNSYSCSCCKKAFHSASDMYKHRIDRTKKKPYVCEVCNKKFKRNYFLSLHVKTDHAPPLRPPNPVQSSPRNPPNDSDSARSSPQKPSPSFMCTICFKRFQFLKSIRDHRRCHSGRERLKCLICSKMFFNSAVIKHHKHILGSNDSKVSNKQSKSFPNSEKPKKIQKRKTLFSCTLCSEKFYQQSKLLEHVKLQHAVN